MTFTIHSIGDSAFLEQILIAVSMVTSSGSFIRMISIGLLMSILLICVKSLMNNCDRIDFQQILVGWLVYSCLFTPTTQVAIENTYTGEVNVVDNVPIGIGAAGGIISSIGHGITRLFETGFTAIAPGITQGHSFAESLKLLNNVRRMTYNAAVFDALDIARNNAISTHPSWHNYIRECTLTKIDIQTTPLTKLVLQPIDQAIKFNSELYTTLLHTTPGSREGQHFTCTDAFNKLTEETELDDPLVARAIGRVIGLRPLAQFDAYEHITNALQTVGAGATSATDFVKTALLEPLYYEAAAGRHQDFHAFNSALMVNQAIQQRNVKWAAEQTMFMTLVRPMLAFFEGFIYAITPLVAFLVIMGSTGFQLLGKYVQTLFWIQLWMPVMAIINLFIHTASSRALAHLANANAGLSSLYTLDAAGDILQHWIATGGMLAASTPVISLFIVSGSTYAMSGLVGRMSAPETIDPKIQSPDIVRQGPMLESSPTYTQNQSGMIATGTEQTLSQVNLGSMLNQGMSDTTTRLNQTSQAFQQILGRSLTEGVSQEQSYARMADIGRSISSQNNSSSQFVNEQAKSFMEKFNVGDEHADAVKGAIAGQVSGSLSIGTSSSLLAKFSGIKIGPANAGLSGAANASSTDKSSWSAEDVSQFMRGIRTNESQSQQLTNQLAQNFSNQTRQTSKETWGDSLSKTLSNSASEVTSVAQSHSEMQQFQKNAGAMINTNVKNLAGLITEDRGAHRGLNEYFSTQADKKTRQSASEISDRYRNTMGMSSTIADVSGKLSALFNTSGHTPDIAAKNSKAGVGAIYRAMGYHPDLDTTNNQSTPPPSSTLKSQVENAVGKGPDGNSNHAKVSSQARTAIPGDDRAIQKHHQQNLSNLQQKMRHADRQVSSPAEQKARSNLLHSLPAHSSASSIFGRIDNAEHWLCRRRDQLGDALFAGATESANTFNGAMEQLSMLTPEQREQFIAATKQGDQAVQQSIGTVGGKLVSSAAKLGNSFIGAAATGYDTAQQWLTGKSGLSEAAKEMTLEQRGAYYSAAFTAAAEAGPRAAVRFMQEYGQAFKQTMAKTAENRYGLTPTQAAVYAESFDVDRDRMAGAVRQLKTEYVERGSNGEALFDNKGQPILSAENEQFTNKLVNILQNSSDAGDRAGSYLTGIKGYNIATKNLNNIWKSGQYSSF